MQVVTFRVWGTVNNRYDFVSVNISWVGVHLAISLHLLHISVAYMWLINNLSLARVIAT